MPNITISDDKNAKGKQYCLPYDNETSQNGCKVGILVELDENVSSPKQEIKPDRICGGAGMESKNFYGDASGSNEHEESNCTPTPNRVSEFFIKSSTPFSAQKYSRLVNKLWSLNIDVVLTDNIASTEHLQNIEEELKNLHELQSNESNSIWGQESPESSDTESHSTFGPPEIKFNVNRCINQELDMYWTNPDGSSSPLSIPDTLPNQYKFGENIIIDVIGEDGLGYPEDRKTANYLLDLIKLPKKRWLLGFANKAVNVFDNYDSFKWKTIEIIFRLLSSHTVLRSSSLRKSEDITRIMKAFDGCHWSGKTIGYLRSYVDSLDKLLDVLYTFDAMCRYKNCYGARLPVLEITRCFDAITKNIDNTERIYERSKAQGLLQIVRLYQQSSGSMEPYFASLSKPQLIVPEWIRKIRESKTYLPIVPIFGELFDVLSFCKKATSIVEAPDLEDITWTLEMDDIYKCVHYSKLRQQFIEPLKHLILTWLKSFTIDEDNRFKMGNINQVFYQDVRYYNANMHNSGQLVIYFKFQPNQPIDWTLGKNLLPGSFVILAKISDGRFPKETNFPVKEDSIIFGVVKEFNLKDLMATDSKDSIVGLHFHQDQLSKLDINTSYAMFASNVYYPMIRASLEWLRDDKTLTNSFRLGREILTCPSTSSSPNYLIDAKVDLRRILKQEIKTSKVFATGTWPACSDSRSSPYRIDSSEVGALKQLFMNKISVTITPIGTCQIEFLVNSINLIIQIRKTRGFFEPIILITRTSRILDSILEKVKPFITGLTRCGQSNCPDSLRSREINTLLQQVYVRDSEYIKILVKTKADLKRLKKRLEALQDKRNFALSDAAFLNNAPLVARQQLGTQDLLAAWLRGSNKQETLQGFQDDTIGDPSLAMVEFATLQERQFDEMNIISNPEYNGERHQRTKRISNYYTSKINQMWNEFLISDRESNIWNWAKQKRQKLRRAYANVMSDYMGNEIEKTFDEIANLESALEDIYAFRWRAIAGYSPLVGMTIAYASKHRNLVNELKSRVILVAEASEIPEASLVPYLSSNNLEHLILIDDYVADKSKPIQQRTTTDQNNISLFERWIKSGASHQILSRQFKIRPEIYDVIRDLYKFSSSAPNGSTTMTTIMDSPELENIPNILGVSSNIRFITHYEFDSSEKEQFSMVNHFEAEYVARFALYLSQQNNRITENITILTPYSAQKQLIWSKLDPSLKQAIKLDEEIFEKILVETIDNFEGKQSHIILLSLTSPSPQHVEEWLNYVGASKRIKHAMSSALYGLYILGNGFALMESPAWNQIIKSLQDKGNYGDSLFTTCKRHPKYNPEIRLASDFDKYVPDGGCLEQCQYLLPCGHNNCPLNCHPIDHAHLCRQKLICRSDCLRDRPPKCTHRCPRLCYQCKQKGQCPPCKALVALTLPCGHITKVPCAEVPDDITQLNGGPKQALDDSCHEAIKYTAPCKHEVQTICGSREKTICMFTCEVILSCGHRCKKYCAESHRHHPGGCDSCVFARRKRLRNHF
ncbi:6564_t:CDS:2 [Ambispora gerdemannii]|uniref:6564_t:CDS:1 n=1 Tax=Ambispora gerdemannii TaxID=144530 RepID=A0A9N8W481_9GLOM|nr:6564_t:CDS:2 [Ambispora gerdemannii]